MHQIYNIAVHIASFFLRLIALFNPKIKLFVDGRKDVLSTLNQRLSQSDETIWIHTASLGEFEQGLPIIEQIKAAYPNFKIVVTFFSPSGYEVKKNTPVADLVTYLPMDTLGNAKRFIEALQPKLAIFVKYEIWPSYLKTLKEKEIPTLLISAFFKEKQVFFKWYGRFMRKSLSAFSHFFVQDENSKTLLKTLIINNVTIGGDTRFDRVSEILLQDNSLDFMQAFKQNKTCFVAGSTWPEDENILVDYINQSSHSLKFVLAPHTMKAQKLQQLTQSISKKAVLYSQIDLNTIADFDVLIVDTIGLLTKIYSYADIAYVGGAYSTGLHNTLEPAVFGIPIIIGPNFNGFKEAEDLVRLKGIIPTHSPIGFKNVMDNLIQNQEYYSKTGHINQSYVANNKGASIQIINYIRTLL